MPTVNPRAVCALVLLLIAGGVGVNGNAAPAYREGVQYRLITPPVPPPSADRVEVTEILWYGCETCFAIQAGLKRWVAAHRGVIAYRRVPAVTSEHMVMLARAFYAAQALGVLDRLHEALFAAIQLHRRRLDSEQALAAFFAEQGIDQDAFHEAFHSRFVAGKLRYARALGERYGIQGAPTLVVNGKYRVDPTMVRSPDELIHVVDFLAGKEGTRK